jgi:pimeloyl-ACP methyl ester carboxylesterase
MLEDVDRRKLSLSTGVEIALLDWGGSGAPILLHHANGFCGALWDSVARALSDVYRVFAVDARGHGDSSKPPPPDAYTWVHFGEDLREVAQTLAGEFGLSRLRAGVGNSFGGTALLLASRRGVRFGDLILVDPVLPPPGTYSGPGEGAVRGNVLSEGALKRRNHWASREEARSWFEGKSLFADWEPHAIDLYVAEGLAEVEGGFALKCPPAVESAIFSQAFASDVRRAVVEVETPTVYARAGRGYFPPELFREAADAAPNGRESVIDSGHLAPMEDPERVVALVRETLGA